MQTVRRRCSKLFDCERCSLFVVDEESSSLVGLSAEDDTTETHFPLRTGLTGRVANSGEKINLKDAYQDPQFRPEIDWQAGYRVRSFLCMPLVKRIDGQQGKTTVGAVQLVNKHTRDGFTEADESALIKLCNQLFISVINYRGLKAARTQLTIAKDEAKKNRKAMLWNKTVALARQTAPTVADTAVLGSLMRDGRPIVGAAAAAPDAPPAAAAAAPTASPAPVIPSSPGGDHRDGDTSPAGTRGSFKLGERKRLAGSKSGTPLGTRSSKGGEGEGGDEDGNDEGRGQTRPTAGAGRAVSRREGKGAGDAFARRESKADAKGLGMLSRESSFANRHDASRDSPGSESFAGRPKAVLGREDSFHMVGYGGGSLTREEELGNDHPLSLARTAAAYVQLRPAGEPQRALTTDDCAPILKLESKVRNLAAQLFGIAREMEPTSSAPSSSKGAAALSAAPGVGGSTIMTLVAREKATEAMNSIHRKRTHAMLDLAQAVLSHEGDEEGLLLASSRCALQMAGAHGCRIFVFEDGMLWTTDQQRRRQQWAVEDAGLTGEALQSGHSMMLERDACEHASFVKSVDWDFGGDPASLLCAPLKGSSNELLGVLTAGRRSEGGFSIEERALLETAGRTSLSLLAQTQLVSRERRARVSAEALINALGSLVTGMSFEQIMLQIAAHAKALLNCRRYLLWGWGVDAAAACVQHLLPALASRTCLLAHAAHPTLMPRA